MRSVHSVGLFMMFGSMMLAAQSNPVVLINVPYEGTRQIRGRSPRPNRGYPANRIRKPSHLSKIAEYAK
jgi:hypothetical protein